MKRLDDGTWQTFETTVGTVAFDDANGHHEANVWTDGEFWRVVAVRLPGAGLTPQAALELGALIAAAGIIAKQEQEQLDEQDARTTLAE